MRKKGVYFFGGIEGAEKTVGGLLECLGDAIGKDKDEE